MSGNGFQESKLSGYPTSQPTPLRRNDYNGNNYYDPYTGRVFACAFLGCTCFAIFVFINRFCIQRRMRQLVAGNSVGQFLVELRPEISDNLDEVPLRDGQSDVFNSDELGDTVNPTSYFSAYKAFVNFFRQRLSFLFPSNGSQNVVETTAVSLNHKFGHVVTCDYDATDEEADEYSSIPSIILKVSEKNVFSMPIDLAEIGKPAHQV